MTVARIAFLGALGASVAALVWTHPATAEDGSTIPPSAPPPSTQPAPVAPPTAEDPSPPAFDPSSDADPPNAPTTAPARDPAPAPGASSAAPAPATIAEPPTVPKPASTVTPAATTAASAPAHSLGTVRPPLLSPTATRAEAVSAQNATPSRKTEAAPLEVQRTQEPNGAVGAGVLIFAISYLPATMFAQSSTAHIDELLYVPLAGPWLDLARRPMCAGNACNTEFGNRALLVTDGMLQDFGFLLTLAGLLSNEAAASVQTAKVVETPARKVRVSPAQFGAGGYGIAAFGKF